MSEPGESPRSAAGWFSKRWGTFAFAWVAMLVVSLTWTCNRGGALDDPPAVWNVDGVFYDNIAFNLNRGQGFSVDLYAPSWRETYLGSPSAATQAEQKQHELNYQWLIPVKGTGPTTLRSPAYPFALALIYRGFGHRYGIARIFGCLFVSLGLAMLLTFSALRWSYLAATIAALTLTLDYSVMNSAGTLATESLAICVFSLTFLLVVRAWERPGVWPWILAGVSFAVLMLTRGIWSLGLLLLIASLVGFRMLPLKKRFGSLRQRHLLALLAAAIVCAAPWWIRNCLTTGHFTPFGTAGSCGFVAAYCDESLADFGQWQPDVFNRNQLKVQQNVNMDTIPLADLEYMTGESSLQQTRAWIFKNWTRIPQLMLYRGVSHWGFYNRTVPWPLQLANVWLVVVGLLGCVGCTGRLRGVFLVVLVLDSLLVMLTWEHLGRYAIPIRPLVHVGYGLAIAHVIGWFKSRFSRASSDPRARQG